MLHPTETGNAETTDNLPTEFEIYAYIGERLKYLRKREGLSQHQVAKLIGLSKQQYQKYEAGTSKCSIHKLLRLCKFYYVVPETIIPFDLNMAEAIVAQSVSANDSASTVHSASTAPNPDEISRLVTGFSAIKLSQNRKLVLDIIGAMARG